MLDLLCNDIKKNINYLVKKNYFQENIQDEYMKQEMKREWNEFKHGVVVNVINYCGIRPGYGKWSK